MRRDALKDRSRLGLGRVRLPGWMLCRHDTGAADRQTGGNGGGRLQREAGPDGRSAPSEERAQRARYRYERERLERTALCALPPCERRALGTFAQVSAQLSALLTRQPAVELKRDRELCLTARQRAFELLAQRAASAEDQCLDGTGGDLEDLRDLRVRSPLELAHDKRRPLVEGEVAERAPDVLAGRQIVVDERVGDVVLERDLRRAASRLAEALAADVVRNRDQPVLRLLRPIAFLD